jgi:hypothetical protein
VTIWLRFGWHWHHQDATASFLTQSRDVHTFGDTRMFKQQLLTRESTPCDMTIHRETQALVINQALICQVEQGGFTYADVTTQWAGCSCTRWGVCVTRSLPASIDRGDRPWLYSYSRPKHTKTTQSALSFNYACSVNIEGGVETSKTPAPQSKT